jgi:hypothetical protein
MKTTVTSCDRCGIEINVLDRMAALVEINPRSADAFSRRTSLGLKFDVCTGCLPLLGEFLGLKPKGENSDVRP